MQDDSATVTRWLEDAATSLRDGEAELYVDVLKFSRTEVFQEWTQLTSRFGSMVSSQSFLLISFCASINASATIPSALRFVGSGLAVVGIITCIAAWLAMRMAQETILQWHRKKRDCLFETLADGTVRERSLAKAFAIPRDVEAMRPESRDRQNQLSLFYVNITPSLFITLWIWLLLWVWMH